MQIHSDDDDIRDAACFRLWVKLAEQCPGRVAKMLAPCVSAEDHRRAILTLAVEERINLPPLPRRISDPCPCPDQAGWTMADCFNAERCACADGIRLGYRPKAFRDAR